MTPVWQIRGRHPWPHDHVGPGAVLGCTLGLLQELLTDALLWVARLVEGKPGEFGSHLEILRVNLPVTQGISMEKRAKDGEKQIPDDII